MRAVVPCHFPFISVIRAKYRKKIDVRNAKRFCLASKRKRKAFYFLILFVVKDRRRANHKNGVLLSPAQNRSDVCAGFYGIDANFPILNGCIIDAT